MATRFVRRWLVFGALFGGPVAVLFGFRFAGELDIALQSAEFHLSVVGAIAACALVVAVLAMMAAIRSSQPGPVFLGIGCTAVGVLMLAHGLTTPTMLGQPNNQWVSRFPYLALVIFAAMLVMASGRADGRLHRFVARHIVAASLIPFAVFALFATVIVIDPHLLWGSARLEHEDLARDVLAGLAAVLSMRSAWVHWHRWQLGRDVLQFALVAASAMNVAAITAFEFGEAPRLSWYDYHGYLLAGFAAAVYAIHGRYRRTQAVGDVLESTFVDDPFEHIVRGYPEALRTLVRAVEVKDRYTHGHSQRTARLATELGLRLGLPSDTLRVIARGAYLHDIGKIGIPDAVLNKPGALDAEERRIIETHPQLGYEMAKSAASLSEALDVILYHHERVDGGGYPEGLRGNEIPLAARVVAVADVWDALTSDRAYRKGWAPPAALAHIVAGRDTHFDGRVVDALVDLAAGWGIRVGDEQGRADEAWAAAQNCHEIDHRELTAVG